MTQDELSGKHGKKAPVGEDVLEGYLQKLLIRIEANKGKRLPRNYMEETANQYLKYIAWDNDTLPGDMNLFWMTIATYYKSHTHYEMVRLLEWVKEKNCLHPKAVVKTFKRADENKANYNIKFAKTS